MASFPGCMTFIPHSLGSWGEKGQQSCHQMETCTHWRKQPAGASWMSNFQCWVLHMGRQNMQKYRPPTYRTVLRTAASGWEEITLCYTQEYTDDLYWNWDCSASRRGFFWGRTQVRVNTSEKIIDKMELWSSQQCMAGRQETKNTNSNSRGSQWIKRQKTVFLILATKQWHKLSREDVKSLC